MPFSYLLKPVQRTVDLFIKNAIAGEGCFRAGVNDDLFLMIAFIFSAPLKESSKVDTLCVRGLI